LKEEKKGGKKDGDQMRITKEKLVEIIKEEIADLDEATLGGLFGRSKKASTRRPRRGPSGADDLDVRAGEIEAMDSAAGLSRGQKKAYSAAIADASSDAAKMDAKSSQKDFERVMKWANDNDIATEKEIESASQKDFERVMGWANDNRIATEKNIARAVVDVIKTMDSGMIAKIQEPLLADEDFIEQLANKIAQYKHTPGE
jgi:hypothetical protein